VAFLVACPFAGASVPGDWHLARSQHFEVYSQSDDASARAMAFWLEQLRGLVQRHTGLDLEHRVPVRVIGFRGLAEFDPYRVRASSSAYYAGSEGRDYIVMAGLGRSEFSIAAHEYAHVVLRAAATDLPLWLREGLAEALSTVRITPSGATIGGDLPGRLHTLRAERWIPLAELLACTTEDNLGNNVGVFYAEIWALADLILLAPSYAERFPQFVAVLRGGANSQQAFLRAYGKSLNAVAIDLQRRNGRRSRIPLTPPNAVPVGTHIESSSVSALRARLLIADVVLLTGPTERAESLYRELEREAPADPDIALGLGTIALRQGHPDAARQYWKRAIENGTADAALCFRYALLANAAGVAAGEIRLPLLRAIELQPDFDDARYTLALLESNAGNHQAAVALLRAMRQVAPARAFGYWIALADSLTQLDRRSEAKAAAMKALDCATTEDQRRHAAEMALISETDLAVRMTRDAQGHTRMVTTRIPHGEENFNPFIEPGDHIERVQGALREIDCAGSVLRVVVETAEGLVTLAIRGLDRVQISKGPAEFTCGKQTGSPVKVEYARFELPQEGIAGDIRGLEFLDSRK
jgi:tetratricopeptide (TPR) repeat protein